MKIQWIKQTTVVSRDIFEKMSNFFLANIFHYKEILKMPRGDGIYTIDLKQSKMIDNIDFNIETMLQTDIHI